jgi:hypothetical protein
VPRSLLIIFCCFFATLSVKGQTILNGHVLENKTRIYLHGVRIQNLSTNQMAFSGDRGEFSIAAKVGDLITFKSFSYQTDTLLVTNMREREVFLEPQKTILNQVTVTDTGNQSATPNKNFFPLYDPEFHGQTVVYHRDRDGNYDGGLTIRLHYFTLDDHNKKKEQKKTEERIISEEISTIFTTDNIGHYLPLKGTNLDNFLLLYTPTVAVYNKKDFVLLAYLNECYKTWLALTPEQRKAGRIFSKQ